MVCLKETETKTGGKLLILDLFRIGKVERPLDVSHVNCAAWQPEDIDHYHCHTKDASFTFELERHFSKTRRKKGQLLSEVCGYLMGIWRTTWFFFLFD